jgi:hypothetical protein
LKSRTPREAHHSHSSTVAPTMRIEACHIGGTSATVVLMRICCSPQKAQQAMSRPMARAVEVGLALDHSRQWLSLVQFIR